MSYEDNFNLEDYLAFELRRGDEYAAPHRDLEFDVTVQRKLHDELELKLDFKNPSMVSRGRKNDVLIVEVQDNSFFSKTNSPVKVKPGT